MTDAEQLYESLIARTSLSGLTPEAALHHLGLLIDISLDVRRPEGLRHAITLAGELSRTPLGPVDSATLDYFLGNAWDNLRRLSRQEDHEAWEWQQEEFEKEITHLRLALRGEGFAQLPAVRRCQILTNLGNAMSELGRFVEAAEYLSRVLVSDASFSMARGNRGVVLSRYAQALYDPCHAMVLILRAREDLKAALRDMTLHPGARKFFEARAAWVTAVLKKNARRKKVDLEGHSLGEQEAEVRYRRWCLEHGLFLNPLNDLGPHPIASHDVLTTPSIVVGLDEGPSYPGVSIK
jgi:tetratricopeptide (TPR) repeat protein